MPSVPLVNANSKVVGWLSVRGDYKPGDPPPNGYLDWHAWARVQGRAGLKQLQCQTCHRWLFPQEQEGHECKS